MKTFEEYLDMVNQAVSHIKYPERPANLYDPIAYTMGQGGKRVRPALALMSADALDGDLELTMPVALAVELFHNFTLLHDDVMDRADVRRGQPTVHTKWNDNVAILSGDAMLTLAMKHLAQAPAYCVIHAFELFNRTAMKVYEGQQLDMDFEKRYDDVTLEEYMEMIRLKTSVLLGASCQLGALVAGAAEATARRIYQVGENMGMAFQVQDDVLDVWGDPATFGKATGGDIMCGKKTFLLINALHMAGGADRRELDYYVTGEGKDAAREVKGAAVTAIYERLGLREHATDAVRDYSTRAIEALHGCGMGANQHDVFVELIERLTSRTM